MYFVCGLSKVKQPEQIEMCDKINFPFVWWLHSPHAPLALYLWLLLLHRNNNWDGKQIALVCKIHGALLYLDVSDCTATPYILMHTHMYCVQHYGFQRIKVNNMISETIKHSAHLGLWWGNVHVSSLWCETDNIKQQITQLHLCWFAPNKLSSHISVANRHTTSYTYLLYLRIHTLSG